MREENSLKSPKDQNTLNSNNRSHQLLAVVTNSQILFLVASNKEDSQAVLDSNATSTKATIHTSNSTLGRALQTLNPIISRNLKSRTPTTSRAIAGDSSHTHNHVVVATHLTPSAASSEAGDDICV